MIIVRYTLTKDGKIPTYIHDGGYFPRKNNKTYPQDYDFIGLSNGNTALETYTTKEDLQIYLQSFANDWAKQIWDKRDE